MGDQESPVPSRRTAPPFVRQATLSAEGFSRDLSVGGGCPPLSLSPSPYTDTFRVEGVLRTPSGGFDLRFLFFCLFFFFFSIDTAAVREVTGDAELKAFFRTPSSPLLPPSPAPSPHLSLHVNHGSLSEASSGAIFKHIEPGTSLSPHPFPSPLSRSPCPQFPVFSSYHLSLAPSST